MSASQSHRLQATAGELLSLLGEHQRAVAGMVAAGPQAGDYELVAAQLDRMRAMGMHWPGATLAWAELLIAHVELVQVLWRPSGGRVDEAALAQASAAHARAATRLEARLLREAVAR